MLPTLDYRDYIITIIVILFLLSFFINTYQYQKKHKNKENRHAGGQYAVNMLFSVICLFIPTYLLYTEPPKAHFVTIETVKTSDYKTVYKNNQRININIKDADGYNITLPGFSRLVTISAKSIDPKAPVTKDFIFTKNGAEGHSERLTETVVAKDSPLKKNDPTGSEQIERIEFAKRTYRFKLWNYSVTRTENIARVTVSYQPDPQKTKKEKAYQEIKNLMNN